MTCSSNGVIASLVAATAAIVIALGLITTAAIMNGSWWAAPGAVPLMFAAAGATAGAMAGVVAAIPLMVTFIDCLRVNYVPAPSQALPGSITAQAPPCATSMSTWYTLVVGIGLALTVQAAACLKAAGIAWIPLLGLAPMTVITAALVVQAGAIAGLIAASADLFACLEKAYRKPGP